MLGTLCSEGEGEGTQIAERLSSDRRPRPSSPVGVEGMRPESCLAFFSAERTGLDDADATLVLRGRPSGPAGASSAGLGRDKDRVAGPSTVMVSAKGTVCTGRATDRGDNDTEALSTIIPA